MPDLLRPVAGDGRNLDAPVGALGRADRSQIVLPGRFPPGGEEKAAPAPVIDPIKTRPEAEQVVLFTQRDLRPILFEEVHALLFSQ